MDREYGVETRIPFTLYEADGINLRTDAVYVLGDVKISKDEGSPQDTDNGFVAVNGKYYITLTATEMQAARISLTIIDQDSTKLWLDIGKDIETYGNASAQHAFNLNSATVVTSGGTIDTNNDMRGTDSALTDKAGFALSDAGIDSILDEPIGDGTITLRESSRIAVSSFASKVSGGGTTTIIYRNNADTQNVIEMTADSTGNRTAIILTP